MEDNRVINIVVISIKYLGDLIVQSSAFKSLRNSYPNANIYLVARKEFADVFKFAPYFNKIIPVDMSVKKEKGIKRMTSEIRILKSIRSLKPDLVVNMQSGDRYTLWAWLSGAAQRVAPKKQGLSFLNNVKVDIEEDTISYLDYYLKLAESSGAEVINKKTEFFVNDDHLAWSKKYLLENGIDSKSLLIGIHPGAADDSRIPSLDFYNSLINEILSGYNPTIIVFSTAKEKQMAGALIKNRNEKTVIADTSESIHNFAALVRQCTLCIVNDSGARHICAAVGVPTLCFIPEDKISTWNFYSASDGHHFIAGKRQFMPNEKATLGDLSISDALNKIGLILKNRKNEN